MNELFKIQNQTYTRKDAVKVYEHKDAASAYVADRIAKIIKNKQNIGQRAIVGLATGSTPKGVYKELIRLHKDEGLSFKNVVTFNLDEYYPCLLYTSMEILTKQRRSILQISLSYQKQKQR